MATCQTSIFFFWDFEAIRAFLGGLTWSKTLENVHTHWNPWQLGRRWGWDPGVAQGSTAPPGKPSENLMCSSHILARIHMKLGTHIDLIELNNFCVTCHGLRPTGSRLFSGCLKSTCSGIWNTPPRIFNTRAPNPGGTWSQDIGDAKLRRDFWYLEWFARGEAMKLWRELRYRKCLIKSTYIVWFWSQFSRLFGVWSRSHRCDNYEAKL